MRHPLLAGLALLVLVPALWGQDNKDKPKPDKPKTPQEQYRALIGEYQATLNAYVSAMRAAKTDEERQKVYQEKYPQATKISGRLIELAESNPKDPAAMNALVWVVQNVRAGADFEKGLALLIDHADSSQIGKACQVMATSPSPKAEKLLRAVMEKNTDAEVQATAAFSLAQNLLGRGERQRNPQLSEEGEKVFTEALAKHGDSKQLGQFAQQLTYLRSATAPKMLRLILEKSKQQDALGLACLSLAEILKRDAEQSEKNGDNAKGEQLSKEAEQLYERIIKEFADVKRFNAPISSNAKGALNELRHLLDPGKPALEIVAEDIDGKPIKLSDYRGKVVMLDFWGHW